VVKPLGTPVVLCFCLTVELIHSINEMSCIYNVENPSAHHMGHTAFPSFLFKLAKPWHVWFTIHMLYTFDKMLKPEVRLSCKW